MLVFTYGTLTMTDMMKYIVPDATDLGVDTLPGYTLMSCFYLTPVPREDAIVMGIVWEVSERELSSLDRYESYPGLYGREEVTLVSGRKALCYFMQDKYREFRMSSHHEARHGYTEHGITHDQIDAANDPRNWR